MKWLLLLFACAFCALGAGPDKALPGGRMFFLAGRHTAVPEDLQLAKEISIMGKYTLVIHLTNIPPGKVVAPIITCTDPKGKLALTYEKAWKLEGSSGYLLYPLARAPEDVPGLYRWKAVVEGVGTLEQALSLLPETPDGVTETPMHEKAAENAFRAFSKYWLGWNGDFFLVLAGPGQTYLASVTNYVNVKTGASSRSKPADFTLKTPAFYGTDEPFYRVEVSEERLTINTIQRLLQVRGLGYDFSKQWLLSPAEELNGITYKGGGNFSFSLYRVFDAQRGWSDWQDVGMWNLWRPHAELRDLPLYFYVLQRDGNWFVTGSDGAKFANGKFLEPGQTERLDAPALETVRAMVERGVNLSREQWKNIGLEARRDPAQIEQEAVNTILQLRRRTVAE